MGERFLSRPVGWRRSLFSTSAVNRHAKPSTLTSGGWVLTQQVASKRVEVAGQPVSAVLSASAVKALSALKAGSVSAEVQVRGTHVAPPRRTRC